MKKVICFILLSCLCRNMFPAFLQAQENRNGSWLPEVESTEDFKEITTFLNSLNGSFRPMLVGYDGVVIDEKVVFHNGKANLGNSVWSCSLKQLPSERDNFTFDIHFKVDKGELKSGGVAVAFDFKDWSRDNFVLIPAYVYNANRFNVETNGYLAPYPKYYLYNKDVPGQLFSNNPRLALAENTPGKIEGLTGNASTPAMCFYSPSKKRAFILLFEQRSAWGDYGMFIEENTLQDEASFVVSAPGVRELRAGFGDFSQSFDTGTSWKEGSGIGLKLCIYSFRANSKQDLYERFMDVRKALTGPNHPRNLTPFSKTLELTAEYKNKNRWAELPFGEFYRTGNGDGYLVGWVGGLMDTYALLAMGDSLSRERVLSTCDFAFGKYQSKSGYFYGPNNEKGEIPTFEREEIPNSSLVRRNADVLFWTIKHFELLQLQGYGGLIKPEWEKAIHKLARAFVDTWKKCGEFGNYVNLETGEVIVYNSASGAMAPAGLVMASRYFNEPEFLEIAKESAMFMYNREIVGLGFTSGACGDIMQDADSESNFAFTESLMALYYITQDKQWLEMACNVANISATWTTSYDYIFPANSTIGKLGGNVAGAVWASTQNKHAAPGVCTMSADHLFKIYRATGDRRYADLLRDINHAHAEVMETPGRVTTGMGPGTSMERIQVCDADGKNQIGVILHTSNGWTEGNGMLMSVEIPGIYIQTDKDEMYVFDHVDAKVVKRDKSGITLEITNPTRFDASVSVFAETSREAKAPLGYHNFLNWRKVSIKSGETVIFTLPHSVKRESNKL